MLRLPCILRLSLLASAIAFVGLASFPGTAAEASSLEPDPATAAQQPVPELDELVPAIALADAVESSQRTSSLSYDAYRR
jgi:hypothetical protein